MSNLSELLPAGSSVKSADFVAQGTLASGVTVGLRSDGKVEAIAGVTQVLGAKAAVASTTLGYYNETAFDSVNNKIVLIYSDGNNSYYPYVVIGTVSTNTISFGTPVVVQSSVGYNTCIAYDANAQKIVVVYGNTSNYINSAVGTVSGTSISFGSIATVASVNGNYNVLYYDPNSTKVVTCYRNANNSSYGTANVGTVSGTSISWGTGVIFQSAYTQYIGIGEGTGTKVGLAYENGNFTRSKYRQGTVSGTSISFDTEIEYVARTVFGVAFVNNLPQDRVVFFYQNQIDNRLYVIVGTGDPVTFGTPTVVSAGSLGADFGAAYDSDADLICVAYRDQNSGAGNTGYLTYQTGTFSSATEVTMGAAQTINAVSSTRSVLTYDTNADRIVVSFDEDTSGGGQANPKAFTILNASTNVSSYVGITAQAISSAATGKVVCKGGAITNTGLIPFAPTAGSPVTYESGFAVTKSVSYDTNANKAVIANRRGSDDYGIVYVGTVSGTSISFGSVVVFNAGTTEYISSAFDSNANKVVIAYTDSSNSGYGTAIVGTVSGTSITFGTEAVFEAAAVNGKSIVFDSTSNKVVIFYEDDANNDYGTAVVGTVSGTSISFGTPVVFDSVNMQITEGEGAAYDSANNRAVVFYRNSSYAGYAAVGTVSGTSISFGTPVKFSSGAAELDYISAAFDSAANKIVTSYTVNNDSGYSKAIVGTVSGTSISFGSEATFESASSGFTSATFNSTINQVVISYTDFANSNYGTLVISTISGTSISFTTPAVFTSTTAARYISTAFDPDTGSVISGFSDQNNSFYAKSVVTSFSNALTPNTAYFVQDDGTISTTSSTTKAGTALSTTSLLLTG